MRVLHQGPHARRPGERRGGRTRYRAAGLALVEAITLIAEGQVPDAVYERAADALSKDEIVAIEWLAIAINSWNRIAVSSRYPVKP